MVELIQTFFVVAVAAGAAYLMGYNSGKRNNNA